MRLIRLRFENLNSLAGKWTIDFDESELGQSGIFAITGPTGAGKSTVLDAISLALYGRTPRLRIISASQNEILSRRTVGCSSEVEFETIKGRFRASWNQRRSKGVLDGKLQGPKRELVDCETGETLATKSKDVSAKIEELSGLRFDQFCRALMLAQGDFAIFLDSGIEERSEVLEAVTGTEIYTKVSAATHAKLREEKNKLAALQEKLSLTDILSDKEREALQKSLPRRIKDETRLNNRVEKSLKKLERLTSLHQAQRELEKARSEDKHFVESRESVEEKRKRLKLAEQAFESDTNIAALEENERQQKEVTEAIVLIEKRVQTRASIREEANKKKRTITKKTRLAHSHLDAWAEKVHTLENDLRKRTSDEELTRTIAGIESELKHVHELNRKQTKVLAAAKEARSEAERWLARSGERKEEETSLRTTLKNHKDAATQATTQRQACTKLSLADVHQKIEEQKDRQRNLHDLKKMLDEKTKLIAQIDNRSKAIEILTHQHKDQIHQVELLLAAQNKQETEVSLLTKQAELESRIMTLEEERSRLQENTPCPLCGSLDHPFVQQEPVITDAEKEIARAKKELKETRKKLGINQVAAAKTDEKLTTEKTRLAEEQQSEQHTASRIVALEKSLQLRNVTSALVEEQSQKNDALISESETLRDDVTKFENAEKIALNAFREIESKLRQNLEEASKQQNKLAQANALAESNEAESKTLTEEISIATRSISTVAEKLEIVAEDPQEVVSLLNARLERWRKEKDELATHKTALEVTQSVAKSIPIQDIDLGDLPDENESDENNESEFDTLANLQARFTEIQDADRALKDQALALKKEDEADAAQNHEKHREKERLLAKAAEIKETLEVQALALRFENADSLRAAFLPFEERQALRDVIESFDKNTHLLVGRIKEIEKQIDTAKKALGKNDDGTTSEDEMLAEIESNKAEAQAMTLKRGEIQARLAADETRRMTLVKETEEFERAKQELQRWKTLHDLIGSADGKKFRNYAQGITFDFLLAHANQALAKMTDRYQLERAHSQQQLELDVIDRYQADERRSVRNISGGERFIIALSLALGLAKMNEGKVPIESLFLDEGFGSLDEETLDSALSALGRLREQGKCIGVISHVRAVQERISAQLQVIPRGDGTSVLRGSAVREGWD